MASNGTLLPPTVPRAATWAWWFCLLTGPFLLLDGLFGLLLAPTSFSVGDQLPREEWNFIFHFNSWHQALHIVNGLTLTAGVIVRRLAPASAIVFALGYAVMAPLGFLDGDDVFDLFYSATAENVVHATFVVTGLAAGVISLAASARDGRLASEHPAASWLSRS